MSRELAFLVYCMERYRHFKGLSGADVARLLMNMVFTDILQSILNHSIQWETIVSYRILTIISAAVQISSFCRVFPPA